MKTTPNRLKSEQSLALELKSADRVHLSPWEIDMYTTDRAGFLLAKRVERHIDQCQECKFAIESVTEYQRAPIGYLNPDIVRSISAIPQTSSQTTKIPDTKSEELTIPFIEKVKAFFSIPRNILTVPTLAASGCGEWSEENQINEYSFWKYREIGDKSVEFRFSVKADEPPTIWVGNDKIHKTVTLIRGPLSWYGSIIFTEDERNKINQSEPLVIKLI